MSAEVRPSYPRIVAAVIAVVVAASTLAIGTPTTAALPPTTALSGVLVGEGAGPISFMSVFLESVDKDPDPGNGSRQTNAAGSFSWTSVVQGQYYLRFAPGPANAGQWPGMYYPQAFSPADAVVITVSGTSMDLGTITVPTGGSVTGTVTVGGPTSAPITVSAITVDSLGRSSAVGNVSASPALDGSFVLNNVPPGAVIVGASNRDSVSEWWPGVESAKAASVVTVVDGAETSGVDIDLSPRGPAVVDRIGGATRFEVAAALSQDSFPSGADTVFIANGLNFPDALSAGPVAALLEAPVLLVTPTSIPAPIAAELNRLAPSRIIIVGGPASVSEAVRAELALLAPVERWSGTDRFDASRNIVRKMFDELEALSGVSTADTAYIVTGMTFPDALSAGARAGAAYSPVILVNGKDGSIDNATRQLLIDLQVRSVIIIGGTASVSGGIFDAINAMPQVESVQRIRGDDRYQVSSLLGSSGITMYVATGAGFADALAGSGPAGMVNAPLVLVRKECVPPGIFLSRATRVVILGGLNSVSAAVETFTPCPE